MFKMSGIKSLKFFWSFGSKIYKYDEKALREDNLILLFSCFNPPWKRTNSSLTFWLKTSGQKGKKDSSTLNPDNNPPKLDYLKSAHKLFLNSGQALTSLVKIEAAIYPNVSAICFFIPGSGSANNTLNN